MPKTPLSEQAGNAGKRKASEALSARAAPVSAPAPSPAPAIAPSRDPAQGAGFDTFIVGALIVAFLVYITAKGELGSYLQLFLYTPPASVTASAAAASGSAASGSAASAPAFQEGQPVAGAANAFNSFLNLFQGANSGGPAH